MQSERERKIMVDKGGCFKRKGKVEKEKGGALDVGRWMEGGKYSPGVLLNYRTSIPGKMLLNQPSSCPSWTPVGTIVSSFASYFLPPLFSRFSRLHFTPSPLTFLVHASYSVSLYLSYPFLLSYSFSQTLVFLESITSHLSHHLLLGKFPFLKERERKEERERERERDGRSLVAGKCKYRKSRRVQESFAWNIVPK